MSVRLVLEVLDHAPDDMTSDERILLVAIAEYANDKTRECNPGREALTHRTGLRSRQLARVFAQLTGRGYEVRVPVGKDTKGRPMFAMKGHRTVFRVPVFRAPKGVRGDTL